MGVLRLPWPPSTSTLRETATRFGELLRLRRSLCPLSEIMGPAKVGIFLSLPQNVRLWLMGRQDSVPSRTGVWYSTPPPPPPPPCLVHETIDEEVLPSLVLLQTGDRFLRFIRGSPRHQYLVLHFLVVHLHLYKNVLHGACVAEQKTNRCRYSRSKRWNAPKYLQDSQKQHG